MNAKTNKELKQPKNHRLVYVKVRNRKEEMLVALDNVLCVSPALVADDAGFCWLHLRAGPLLLAYGTVHDVSKLLLDRDDLEMSTLHAAARTKQRVSA